MWCAECSREARSSLREALLAVPALTGSVRVLVTWDLVEQRGPVASVSHVMWK